VGQVAVIFQPVLPDARPLAERCARHVAQRGHESLLVSSWDLGPEVPPQGLSLAVAFGGDGTILRVARWLAEDPVPIVGVKLGRLGFLAELLPGDLFASLDPYLDGDYWLDARTMLSSELLPAPAPAGQEGAIAGADTAAQDLCAVLAPSQCIALNDVVVSRGAAPRALRAVVEVDGTELVNYTADGIIVATATGSTAYSLAAGGPVLAPELPNLVVTAICPHINALNGLVLPPDVAVTIRVWTPQPAGLTLDGHIDVPLLDGQGVTVRTAEQRTLFARRGPRSQFYRALIDKLRWLPSLPA
jgi:NAD+ kinase